MNKQEWRSLFDKEELEHFLKLGAAMHDPEEKKAFFDSVIESKRADPNWNLFTFFPVDKRDICGEIIEMLKHGGAKTKEEREGDGFCS